MILSDHRWLRVTYLCGLYFAQGIPWGFVSVTLAAWMVSKGYSTNEIGPVIGTATLPWSFKFLWGPVMDGFSRSGMGRRRPWILFAQFGAVVSLVSIAFWAGADGIIAAADKPGSLEGAAVQTTGLVDQLLRSPIAMIILLANIFISMLDVATDALAVDILPVAERGRVNGFMYASNYAGTAFGGAGLGLLVSRYGLNAGLAGQAAVLVSLILITLFIRERRSDQLFPGTFRTSGSLRNQSTEDSDSPTSTAALPEITERPVVPSVDRVLQLLWQLGKAFWNRDSLLGLILAFVAKLGIGCLTAVLVVHLVQKGVWTNEEYTLLNGGVAVAFGLAGSVLGGLLSDFRTPRTMIITASILIGILWMTFGLSEELLSSQSMTAILLCGQEFLLSMLTVAMFAFYMNISWSQVAATQFTAYMAILNFSSTIGSFLAARLTEQMSVPGILLLCSALQVLSIVPLLWVRERHREP
ncbi:MAG: MFS transporter [Planctomyces sp.]|nr:MFS transporter [Planctomyces sp.]